MKLHDEMLADGTLHSGWRSDGVLIENGKPVAAAEIAKRRRALETSHHLKASVEPITRPKSIEAKLPSPVAADVVVRPPPKSNAAPRVTDAPRVKQPTGLMRAIAANSIQREPGQRPALSVDPTQPTGLQRAINANLKAQSNKKTQD